MAYSPARFVNVFCAFAPKETAKSPSATTRLANDKIFELRTFRGYQGLDYIVYFFPREKLHILPGFFAKMVRAN